MLLEGFKNRIRQQKKQFVFAHILYFLYMCVADEMSCLITVVLLKIFTQALRL